MAKASEDKQIERDISDTIQNQIGIITIRETDETLIYDNGVYNEDKRLSRVRELITEISKEIVIPKGKDGYVPYNLTISKRNIIIEMVKTDTFRSIKEFDTKLNKINCKNGHLFLKDKKWEFIKHFKHNEQPYLSRVQIPINYDPNAENLEIDQVFTDVFGFNIVPLIYEMIGYFLLPHTKYSKAFMLYGETGTGKTSVLNIITQFIGYDHISGIELQALDEKFELEKTRNKLINLFDDLSSKPIEYVGNFKKLVTNTWLYGRIKFIQDEIRWKNRCKGLFACNILPKIKEYISDAFWIRWVLIPCFNDMKALGIRDSKIREKKYSESELSGLLNKVLQAIIKLEERGNFPEEWQNIEYVKNRWNMNINPVALFVEECCEKGESYEVDYEQFFSQLNKFRKEKRVLEVSKRAMTISLKRLGIKRKDRGSKVPKERRYYYSGIQFKEDYILEHEELQNLSLEPTNKRMENYINGDY